MAEENSKQTEIENDEDDPFDVEFPKLFYVNDLTAVKEVIQNYELRTKSQFSTNRETKNFSTDWSIYSALPKHRIIWQDREGRYEKIPFDGIPFVVVGKRSMSCTFGPTYRRKPTEEGKKLRNVVKRSVNCPAQISIREIHKFPEYYLTPDRNTKHQREKMMRELKDALLKKKAVGDRRFYVTLPRMREHKGHDFDKDISKLRTDYRVTKKLTDLIYRRVFDPNELQQQIFKYIQEDLFKGCTPPPKSDARFYPSRRRILNISYNTRVKMQEEGIAVPIPLMTDKLQKEVRLLRGKRSSSSLPGNSKRRKTSRVVVQSNEVVTECVVDSTDAAETLLLLDKPTENGKQETSEDECEADANDDTQEDNDENQYIDNLKNLTDIEVDSSEVTELHPEKQDCLDLLEKLKPLIVFANTIEPIIQLKATLQNHIKELEGCFG